MRWDKIPGGFGHRRSIPACCRPFRRHSATSDWPIFLLMKATAGNSQHEKMKEFAGSDLLGLAVRFVQAV